MKSKTLDQIRSCINKNKTEEAIELLQEELRLDPIMDDVIMQSARNHRIKTKIRNGIVSYEESNITQNRINKALLEICREIEKYNKSKDTSKKFLIRLPFVIATIIIILATTFGVTYYHNNFFKKNEMKENGKKLKLGLSNWVGFAPFYLAEREGLLPDWEFVDLSTQTRTERWNMINDGSVDIWGGSLGEGITDQEKIAKYRITQYLVLFVNQSEGGDGIIVKPNIKSIEDLKGKTIGAWEHGTSFLLLKYRLKQAGLSIKDVKFIDVESPVLLVEQFNNGRFDAIATWSPWQEKATKTGEIIANGGGKYGPPEMFAVLFSNDADKLEREEEATFQLFKGWDYGIEKMNEMSPMVSDSLTHWFGLSNEEVLSAIERTKLLSLADNQYAIRDWNSVIDQVEQECIYNDLVSGGSRPNLIVFQSLVEKFNEYNQ